MAEQLEFFPVPSPCRGICQSDERGFCRGCLRSRDERFNWQKMSDAGEAGRVAALSSASYAQITRKQTEPAGRTSTTLTLLKP
ncbi:Predicted Fe-S protein [Citrobacter koseri]|uniref:Predicted Fe-S protein n=1 Tax=Citrobacter koseri TaxID=545 RepID=A0A2X2YMG6_CITKO|nr:Predicted Fe-S protein [Citrobacter koseri]